MTFDPLQQPKWTRRFVELAQLVATWSKDPSTKVGAVIVDDLRRVIATGYNGFPRGVRDDAARYADRAVKYPLVVHAEANAILNAVANVRGATLVATMLPCAECAKLIVQSGIACVAAPRIDNDRWTESHTFARMIFNEAEVHVIELDGDAESAASTLTIDDARAMFATVLAPVEKAFVEYAEVRVHVSEMRPGIRARPAIWECALSYRGLSHLFVYLTAEGFSYTFLDAAAGVVATQDPTEVSGYILDQFRRARQGYVQNHTNQ